MTAKYHTTNTAITQRMLRELWQSLDSPIGEAYISTADIGPAQVREVTGQPGGRIWIARYGDGLGYALLDSGHWQQAQP